MKSEEEGFGRESVIIAEAASASLSMTFAGGFEDKSTELVNIRSSRWSGSGWTCVSLHIGVGGGWII